MADDDNLVAFAAVNRPATGDADEALDLRRFPDPFHPVLPIGRSRWRFDLFRILL